MRFEISKLSKIKTIATLIATLMTTSVFILTVGSTAFSQNQCRSFFEVVTTSTKLKIPLIPMSHQYHGENTGKYLDPITKQKWQVIYFSESQKKRFSITYKNKLFWTHHDQKANSDFDSEALSFNHSLIIIDKDFQIFTLPYEERGKYHHSSLSSGKDVLFAGTVAFSEGILRELSDLSGHYKPTPDQTLLILQELRRRGVDLSKLKLSGRIAQVLGHTPMLMPLEVQEEAKANKRLFLSLFRVSPAGS